MTQKFIVSVQAMCTSDDADLVTKWSAIVDEADLHKIDLTLAAKLALKPFDNSDLDRRPMTDDEIREYREFE
jgi:hypothetical protein